MPYVTIWLPDKHHVCMIPPQRRRTLRITRLFTDKIRDYPWSGSLLNELSVIYPGINHTAAWPTVRPAPLIPSISPAAFQQSSALSASMYGAHPQPLKCITDTTLNVPSTSTCYHSLEINSSVWKTCNTSGVVMYYIWDIVSFEIISADELLLFLGMWQ